MHSTTWSGSLQLPMDVPFAFSLDALFHRLQTLTDQRDPRGVRYPLAPLLTLAICAKLAGASRVEALADWARFRAPDLTTLFGLPRPTMPHARTWGRIFAHAVDPVACDRLTGDFFHAVLHTAEIPPRGSVILAVDGKTLRGTIPLGATHGVHLVAAYLPQTGVVLAQLAVDCKANEIVVVPTLLAQLDLTGMVVTGDAMQTQRALSTQIVEAGGDYLWVVKANQPALHQDITRLFAPEAIAPGCGPVPDDFTTARTIEHEHGRVDERVITVSGLLKEYTPWPYLEQVFKLERTVTDSLGRVQHEVRYGVTSLPAEVADAARLLHIVRTEWGIENGLHYRRDVSLQEDASQMRRGQAPQVLATLNNTVVSLVTAQGTTNLAKMQREFQYRFDRALARLAQTAAR